MVQRGLQESKFEDWFKPFETEGGLVWTIRVWFQTSFVYFSLSFFLFHWFGTHWNEGVWFNPSLGLVQTKGGLVWRKGRFGLNHWSLVSFLLCFFVGPHPPWWSPPFRLPPFDPSFSGFGPPPFAPPPSSLPLPHPRGTSGLPEDFHSHRGDPRRDLSLPGDKKRPRPRPKKWGGGQNTSESERGERGGRRGGGGGGREASLPERTSVMKFNCQKLNVQGVRKLSNSDLPLPLFNPSNTGIVGDSKVDRTCGSKGVWFNNIWQTSRHSRCGT